jgi:hypothetical protein
MFKFCNMHVQKFEHACSNFEQHAEIATMLTWDFFQNLMFRVKSHVQSGTCMFHMYVFITGVPNTKLCAWGEEDSGGHVL